MKTTTYTIHRGTVRTSEALFTHRLGIYERQDRARFNLSALDRHSPARHAAETEIKNATARAEEASKMHLVPFVPPYVPAKASRVFQGLKSCTSPRRADIARQRALFAAAIGTPEQARASGFKWYETDIKNAKITIGGHEITGAYTETSIGYTAR